MTEEIQNVQQPEATVPAEPKPSACKNKLSKWLIGMNAALLLAVIAIFVLHFKNSCGKNAGPVNNGTQNTTFAFINTDTVWSRYQFVEDVKGELAELEKNLQSQYSGRMSAFEKEYNDYLKKGTSGQLSLDEQKKTEEKLAKKQQELTALDGELTQQLMAEKEKRNMEVHDTIVSYIARFNKSKSYTFIFERSYGGTLLYADPALDITDEIMKGLSDEYGKIKENRQKQPQAN
jgi:outer membrane protein